MWKSSESTIYHVSSGILLVLAASSGAVEMAAYARSDSPPLRWHHYTLMLSICPLLWCLPGTYQPAAVFNSLVYLYFVLKVPLIQPAEARMKKDGEMIRIKGILQRPDDMRDYQDTCLSYSYCRILTRLYFGISPTEEGHPDELTELLSTDCDRVFTIVEVQLAFLHDYYFTTYHSMISSPPGMRSVAQEVWAILGPPCLYWLSGCWLSGGVTFGALGLAVFAAEVFINVLIDWLQRRPILPMYWRTLFNALKKYPQDTGLVYSPTVLELFVGKLLTA